MMMLDALDANEPTLPTYKKGMKYPAPFIGYIAGLLSSFGFNILARSLVDLHDTSRENVEKFMRKNFERSDFVKATLLDIQNAPSVLSKANETHSIGDIPLFVYGAGNGLVKNFGWNTTNLVRLSTRGVAVTIPDSSHSMNLIKKNVERFNVDIVQMIKEIRK
jgi:hypothetical protein